MIVALLALVQVSGAGPIAPLSLCEPGYYGRLISAEPVNVPAIGDIHEVEIGQGMISSAKAELREAEPRLTSAVTFTGRYLTTYTVTVPAGPVRRMIDRGVERLVPWEYDFKYATERSSRRSGAGRPAVYFTRADDGTLAAHVNTGLSTSNIPVADARLEFGTCTLYTAGSLKRELSYSGISQGSITLEYREFINDMARPAFSQTLRYDLNEGREVGFRGSRFEILDANNVSVRYRVIRPLDQ